jgi:hypothetical protein
MNLILTCSHISGLDIKNLKQAMKPVKPRSKWFGQEN